MRLSARLLMACWAVGVSSTASYGADYLLRPVEASGSHTIIDNRIVLGGGGQTVTLEIRVDDWNPVGDTGICLDQVTLCDITDPDPCPLGDCFQSNGLLRAYQATIDASGYGGVLTNLDALIDTNDPEHVFSGLGQLAAVNTATDNYIFGSVLMDSGQAPVSEGVDKCCGTLVIDVPAGAAGSYNIGIVDDLLQTFLRDTDSIGMVPITVTGAIVTIACETNEDCNDGDACTTDFCDPALGCVHTPIPDCICVPDCANRECGDDGCGGSCGTCPDDGLFCTGDPVCTNGKCAFTGDPCNVVSPVCCEALDACVSECCSDEDCPDDFYCNGEESCQDGVCMPGEFPCGDDCCDEATNTCGLGQSCSSDGDCGDGDACTSDACVDGCCVNTPECSTNGQCNDNDPRTSDSCEEGCCINAPLCTTDEDCDDDDPCTTDSCNDGLCENTPLECPDDESCVDGECVECLDDERCEDDGVFCNGPEICLDGECVHQGSPCAPDEACVDDLCRLPCVEDGECPGPLVCREELCVREDPASGALVQPQCGTDDVCSNGLVCAGAYCLEPCTSDENCSAGEICGDGFCGVCISDADCRDGQRCVDSQCCVPSMCGTACTPAVILIFVGLVGIRFVGPRVGLRGTRRAVGLER